MASLEDLPVDVRDQLALLAKELSDDPKTRKQFLRLAKEKRPNIPFPEIEIEDQTNEALSKAMKELDDVKGKLMERDAQADLDKRRAKLISSGKAASLEEVDAIEKVMVDKKIADHDVAADYWRWMNQAATPTAPNFHTGLMDKSARDQLGKFWKNPTQAARDEASAAILDFRRANGRVA